MRIIGLDYGSVRVGIAISDPDAVIAQPKGFIEASPRKKCIAEIANLCSEMSVGKIVIGLPKHMNGDEGESALAARALGDEISKAVNIPILFIDERLTTLSANRSLTESNMKAPRKKEKIDSVAAAIILQNYLDMISS